MLRTADKRLHLGNLSRVIRPWQSHRAETFNAGAATATMTDVVANSSTNTKSTPYVELAAATAFSSDWVQVYVVKNNTAVVADYLLDIAVGAASSEVDVISNLLLSSGSTLDMGESMLLPLRIPAGSRIAARCQSTDSSAALRVGIYLIRGGHFPGALSRVTTYGADTSDSGGTVVDPGGSAGTVGSWTEISAAITNPVKWLGIGVGNRNNAALGTEASAKLDIGIGAAAAEVTLIEQIPLRGVSATDRWSPSWHSFPAAIPAGSRLVARLVSTDSDTTDRLIDVACYGVD